MHCSHCYVERFKVYALQRVDVLTKIHHCTFRPKDFLPEFFDRNSQKIPISPVNILMTFVSRRPKNADFSQLFTTFSPNFPFSSLKNSADLLILVIDFKSPYFPYSTIVNTHI